MSSAYLKLLIFLPAILIPACASSFQHWAFCMMYSAYKLNKQGDQSIGASGASASASVLPKNIQDQFPLGLTGLISCSPRDSQESSPPAQFKSISSSALSFLYGPTLTSIHDYWKNHSFDYMDLNPEYSLEGLMLKLKLQYFGHLMQITDSTDAGKE